MTVLVIAEHDNVSLKGATFHTVSAAAELFLLGTGEVHLLVAGQHAAEVAIAATKISGVARVIYAEGESLAHGLAENIAAQVLAFANHYSHILFPATAWGKNVAPRVAAKLNVAQVNEVTGIIAVDTFETPVHVGNLVETVLSADRVKVLTVCTTGFDAAGQGGSATIEGVAAVADSGNCLFAKTVRSELVSA